MPLSNGMDLDELVMKWVQKHRRMGESDADAADRYFATVRERFAGHCEEGPTPPGFDTPCTDWTGALSTKGYGQFGLCGLNVGAHRVALLLEGVTLRPGMVVRHLCHRKTCVNPAHLVEGTYLENARDRLLLEQQTQRVPPTPEEEAVADELADLIEELMT